MEAFTLLKEELNMANAVLTLLEPLNERVRLYLIAHLSRSVNSKASQDRAAKLALLDKVCGSWKDDGFTVEEEIRNVRNSRTQGLTRTIESL